MIKLIEDGCVTYYEVKPFAFAEYCIRAGLGQLLSYVHADDFGGDKNIKIVDPYPPNRYEKTFIVFIKGQLTIDFSYEAFDLES